MRTAPDHHHHTAGRKPRRPSRIAVLAVVLALLAGCSGGEDEPPPEPGGASSTPDVRLVTDARLGKLEGRLRPARRAAVVRAVTSVVDAWSTRAYGGDYPRTTFGGAFAAFTPDARALARRRSSPLSNAAVGGDLEAVTIARRVVRVDVLAPRGKVAGATARIRIVLDLSGTTDRREVVAGRLLLSPTANGWRVFGFDVSRGKES